MTIVLLSLPLIFNTYLDLFMVLNEHVNSVHCMYLVFYQTLEVSYFWA